MYEQGALFEKVRYLASYTDGNPLKKLLYYFGFLGRYLITLLTVPSLRLVHIHTASYASFTRKSLVVALAKLFQKKVILHVHGAEFALFYQKCGLLRKKWLVFILGICDCLIALSDQWKRDLHKISPGSDIRVVYNPTILRDLSLESGLPHQKTSVQFLFMGRIGKRKGVYDIVESMRQVQSEHIQIHLYGDGDVAQLQKLVNETGLERSVKVCGWIDGSVKDATFRNADVLLLPSYNEGLPISVLEAMAYGLPVLATHVGGIPEAVTEGKNGFLIAPGHCADLADRIERLASSVELRQKMGRAGYEMAAARFSLPVIIQQLESLYDEFTQ
ncbi:glycosyltransferase family 4 protein [Vampirovibrio sp.]|uniref:glycosyltransferase family 4 protein n=1 Tax=Vampirovibrio sp. TaxID=2717857 RepID=UPI0035937A5F